MAGASGAVRAGAAFVEIFSRDSALYKSLDKAEGRVRKFAGMMFKAGVAIAGAGAAVRGPLEVAKKFAIDDGAEIDRLAKEIGTTSEVITSMGYAVAKSGVAFSELSGLLEEMPVRMSELADGAGASAEAFRRLGIDSRNLINTPADEYFAKVADQIAAMKNPADQVRFAMETLGEKGRALLPVLRKGGDAFRQLVREAGPAGEAMPTEQAERSAAAARAMTSAYETVRKVFVEVGAALIPSVEVIDKLSAQFQAGASAVKAFIRENKAVIAIVGAVASGLVASGTALAAVGGVLAVVAGAVGSIVTAIAAIGSAIVSIVGAIGLPVVLAILAAVVAIPLQMAAMATPIVVLVAALHEFFDVGRETFAGIKAAVMDVMGYFAKMFDTFSQAWKAVKSAVQSGDMQLAWNVVTAALTLEWSRAMVVFTSGWNTFKGFFVDGAHAIATQAELAWVDLKAAFLTTLGAMIAKLEELWAKSDGVADFMLNVFKEAGTAIREYLGGVFGAAAARGKAAFLDMVSSWQNVLKSIGFINFPGAAAAAALIEKNKEAIKESLAKAGEKGQAAYDQFAAFRDKKAAELGAAAGAGKDSIEADRARKAQEIRDRAAAELEARRQSRAGDLEEAKNSLAAAEEAFADALGAVSEAEARRAESEAKVAGKGGGPGGGDGGVNLPTLTRGTFSGAGAGQFFAEPGIQQRQLRAAEQTNVKIDETNKKLDALIEGSGKGPVFK